MIAKIVMSNLSGIAVMIFAWFSNVSLGDLSWLKYVVPYVCGVIIYITYNRYNAKRKYNLAEMSLSVKTLQKINDDQKIEIEKLKLLVEQLRTEKEEWMLKSFQSKMEE